MNFRLIMHSLTWLVLVPLLAFAGTARANGGDGLHQLVDGYRVTLAFPAAPPDRRTTSSTFSPSSAA